MTDLWLPPGTSRPGNVSPELLEVQSKGYRPPIRSLNNALLYDRPLFTIQSVEAMRLDPAVKLGMALKRAPVFHLKFTSTASDPAVKEFIDETVRTFWLRAIPKVISGMWYSRSGGEVVYTHRNGRIEFDALKQFYPSDFQILTREGSKWGLRVKNRRPSGTDESNAAAADIILSGMKCFLYVHNREFGSWDGRSEFDPAWSTWLEKHEYGGAIAIRRLWYYKNAFHGGTIRHPPGSYAEQDANGDIQYIPYRDLARQIGEQAASGATYTVPNELDENGNPMWGFDPPALNGSGDGILQYIKELDIEMLHAMEIPDDIVQQVGGTGSYAGRTIPMSAFFSSQSVILQSIFHAMQEQILEPLIWLNFGQTDYEIEGVSVDMDALMPSPPSSPNEAAPQFVAAATQPQQPTATAV